MLGKLELKIKAQEKLGYQMSSLFHGALMELLPADYADYMHVSQLHPYTQHLEYREGEWYWVICCLNKEAVKIIIQDTLWNITSIKIKNRDLTVQITQKNYSEIAYQELMNHFYEKDYSPFIQIHFLTPTAFKKQGKYLFYPDIRCIFQSLMNKYDSVARNEKMVDMDTLEQLTENAQIVRYDLKSVSFSLEGVKIPAFIGKVVVKMNGTRTISNFANMLFEFGEYSGVGIKTALASCVEQYLDEQKEEDYRKCLVENAKQTYDEKIFLLYSMDISGIQKFIYTIGQKGALKGLRARSFYLEIMMEHLVDELLMKLSVSRANLIYTGGGHCYILLPNTDYVRKAIERYEKEVNHWFVEKFDIALYMASGYAVASANDLRNEPEGSYSELFLKISKMISEKKSHRYNKDMICFMNNRRKD